MNWELASLNKRSTTKTETEFKKVIQIDPTYKEGKAQVYLDQTIAGLKRLEELEAQERAVKRKNCHLKSS